MGALSPINVEALVLFRRRMIFLAKLSLILDNDGRPLQGSKTVEVPALNTPFPETAAVQP